MGEFHREQKRVAASMVAAFVATSLTLSLLWWKNPFGAPRLADATERVAYALSLSPFVMIWLVAAIGNVARLRFFSPVDIAGNVGSEQESDTIRHANAVLRNTLEQVVLALGTSVALAARMPAGATGLLQGLVGLFCLGRLLFWVGYRGGAASRALGFALTFYPSVAACLLSLILIARG